MAYYWPRLGVGHASLRSRYWWYLAAAGIGQTVWRAMLLDVLFSTAERYGFIQTTSTPGRFYWSRRLLLFHDLVTSVLQWNGTSSSHIRCRMTASLRANGSLVSAAEGLSGPTAQVNLFFFPKFFWGFKSSEALGFGVQPIPREI